LTGFFLFASEKRSKTKRKWIKYIHCKKYGKYFSFFEQNCFQKEKSDINRQEKQSNCLLYPLFFSFLGADRGQKEKMDLLMFSINRCFMLLHKKKASPRSPAVPFLVCLPSPAAHIAVYSSPSAHIVVYSCHTAHTWCPFPPQRAFPASEVKKE